MLMRVLFALVLFSVCLMLLQCQQAHAGPLDEYMPNIETQLFLNCIEFMPFIEPGYHADMSIDDALRLCSERVDTITSSMQEQGIDVHAVPKPAELDL